MKHEFAQSQYTLSLSLAASQTRYAEDRPLYEKLLADAAVILALLETEASLNEVLAAVNNHDRLRGSLRLKGDDAGAIWVRSKQQIFSATL